MKKEPKNEYLEKKLKEFDEKIPTRVLNADNPQYVLGWNMCKDVSKDFFISTIQELQGKGELERLIEELGDDLEQLWNVSKEDFADGHKWEAHTDGYCLVGKTPLEALQALKKELEK